VNVLQKILKPRLQGVMSQQSSSFLKIARFKVAKNVLVRVFKLSSFADTCMGFACNLILYWTPINQHEQSLARKFLVLMWEFSRETKENELDSSIVCMAKI
jgi:hypothetical protein